MATQTQQRPDQGSKKKQHKKPKNHGAGASTLRGPSPRPDGEVAAATFLSDQRSPEANKARTDENGSRSTIAARVTAKPPAARTRSATKRGARFDLAVWKRSGKELYERVSRFVRARPLDLAATGLALYNVLGRRARRA